MNILLAEDSEDIRETLAEGLRETGLTVSEVSDGWDALKTLKNSHTHFDILITDYHMPRIGGGTLIQTLEEDKISLSGIILISGGDKEGVSGKLENFLKTYKSKIPLIFIEKPFSLDRLLREIYELKRLSLFSSKK